VAESSSAAEDFEVLSTTTKKHASGIEILSVKKERTLPWLFLFLSISYLPAGGH
jgi:hypothetical protein